MTLLFHITNRFIERLDKGHIPSGGINDVKCIFSFEEGYGWESYSNITAIFARETKWAFEINIQPDTPFYVPASILARQGTVFVSLIATNDTGAKVAQTLTVPVVVEPNGLNRNTQVIYPLDQHNEYDTDAYAQYVAAVTTQANRAETALRKLEDQVISGTLVVNTYTKTESDARYMKKKYLTSSTTTGSLDISCAETGSIPALQIRGELPITTSYDNPNNPSSFDGVTEATITYSKVDGTILAAKTVTIGNVYKLNNTVYDWYEILPSGNKIHKETNMLPLSTSTHSWINDTTLRVQLSGTARINQLEHTILSNFGVVVASIDPNGTYIDITLPRDHDLTDYKILYAVLTPYEISGSLECLPAIVSDTSKLTVFVKQGAQQHLSTYIQSNFEADVEKQLTILDSAITNINSQVTLLNTKYTALEARVKALEEKDA